MVVRCSSAVQAKESRHEALPGGDGAASAADSWRRWVGSARRAADWSSGARAQQAPLTPFASRFVGVFAARLVGSVRSDLCNRQKILGIRDETVSCRLPQNGVGMPDSDLTSQGIRFLH